MRRRLLVALGLAALTAAACSPEATRAPPSAATLADDLELVTPRVDLGRTVPGGYVTGTLKVRAKERPAVVTRVEPTCGCTISDAKLPAELAPGEVFEAPVAMDLSRLTNLGAGAAPGPSTVERKVVVASQRGARLEAMVAVEVSDRVFVQPPQVRFGTVAPGLRGSAFFEVTAPAGAPRPRVIDVRTGRPEITATTEIAEDGVARVTLSWAPLATGEMDAFVTVGIDDPKDREVRVRIQGRCEALVTVEPDHIENLAASPARPLTALVTLRRVDEQPLRIVKAACTSHRVEVEVEPGEGAVRVIRLLVPVLPLPGEITAQLVVRTDAPGAETIEIPIRVRAAM